MTIYTPGIVDKDSKENYPEVVTTESEPLTCPKDQDCEAVPVPTKLKLKVTYHRHQQKVCCVHFTLVTLLVIFLTCGAIGSVIFYRHLNRKVTYSGVCGVRYTDPEDWHQNDSGIDESNKDALIASEEPDQIISHYDRRKVGHGYSSQIRVEFAEEGIEVSEVERYEYLHMPMFGEVRETNVWHDFKSNFSAIIDGNLGVCYIMHLNRSAIAPPKSVIDILFKTMSGYIEKYAQVIHHSFKVVKEMSNLDRFGSRIKSRCEDTGYNSFFVEKIASGVFKRSVGPKALAYSMMNNFIDNPQIYKMYIHA